MDDGVAEILDMCLVRLEAGASVDACLSEHPQQRAELEAPLLIAATLTKLPRPAMPAATRAALESQMLARAAARRAAQEPVLPVAHVVPNAEDRGLKIEDSSPKTHESLSSILYPLSSKLRARL